MFPPPPNPVASTEHGCRDSHLPAVPHTEGAEEKGRRVVLGMSELSHVYSSHHHEPSDTTESQDAATEAADPSCQRQDTSEGMSGKWHGKGNTCQLCGAITNDKGEITGTSKSVQRKLVTDEEKHPPNRTVEGRTELDLVQDEVDESKRLLEEDHVEVQAAQNKVTEAAFRVEQAMEEMAQIRTLLEAKSEPASQ